MSDFMPNCLPLLVGSVPMRDHRQAVELVFAHTPQIPIWPQLPVYSQEGMVPQFLPGMPGIDDCDGKTFINTEKPGFDQEFLAFYEEYLLVAEGVMAIEDSRFSLSADVAKGFFELLDLAGQRRESIIALKGQITGPFTFCTGVVDQGGRVIFYNEQLKEAAVKLLALKAAFQAKKMAEIARPAIVVFDEPGLSGFGTSAFITISKEDVISCLDEVFAAVKEEGGLTGVHVCGNTEWSLLFEAGVDIVSYDAYGYFDRLILYRSHLVDFLARGGMLATGIVPTSSELIEQATVDQLVDLWFEQTAQLEALGIARETVYRQSFITPSCGTGTVSMVQAEKVLAMTRDVSAAIREKLA